VPVTKSEAGDPGEVFGAAPAPGGRAPEHALVQPRHVATRAAREVGVDPAGQHGVHLDVVFCPRGRERARELHQPALARAVGRDERGAEERHHRADVDDLAAFLRQEKRIGRLAGDEGARQIGVEHLVPFVERVVLRRLADVDAGVVHQDVEPAEALGGLADHGAAGGLPAYIGEQRDRFASDFLQLAKRRRILVGVAPGDGHGRPGARQAERHAEADAAVAAGNERRLAAQIEHERIIHYLTKASIVADDGCRCRSMRSANSTASTPAASAW
jgi:hypothetical protein